MNPSEVKVAARGRGRISRLWMTAKLPVRDIVSLLAAPASVLPRFPSKLFYVSMLAGPLIMVLGGWISANFGRDVFFRRSASLDTLTAYADPLLIQVLWTAVIVATALVTALSKTRAHSNRSVAVARVVTTTLLPIGIFVATYVVGDLLFKPALGYDRPSDQLPEPPFTVMLRPTLGALSKGDSAPSGFVVRQIALYVGMWLILQQPFFDVKQRRFTRTLLHIANNLLVIFIPFSRIYRRAHSFFDVSLSVGVGTVIVWTLITFIYRASSRQYTHISFTTVASNLALFAVLAYYANRFDQLILALGVLLALYTVHFLLVECCGDTSGLYSTGPSP